MRRDEARLHDIIEAAERIAQYLQNKTLRDLMTDKLLADGVIRQLIVVGEAAAKITGETRALAALPWRDIIAFRNILVHEYFGLDYLIIWTAATRNLREILPEIRRLAAELKSR